MMEDTGNPSSGTSALELLKWKMKLQKKLEDVKTDLSSLNKKLTDSLQSQSTKIKIQYSKYLTDLKDKTISMVQDKEKKIKDKEILGHFYYDAFRNIKRMEQFEKNLGEVILDSLNNYNNFLTTKLPYYKHACHQFLLNNEEKLCNNNIYSKLTKKQVDKLYHQIRSKNLSSLINGRFPVNLQILISENFMVDCAVLSSTAMNKINIAQIDRLNDNSFTFFFNNVREDKNNIINNLIFNNCELKNIEIAKIPFGFQNLKITNSKIFSSIFNNMSFENLVKFNLDNVQLDTYNFEKIFGILLKSENNNLKEISFKNNYISRVLINDEIYSKAKILTSLEILNLSNNSIYKVDNKIFNVMPNLKILDLSNNCLLHQNNCKELINNCKGIVLLLKNIAISKDVFYNYYTDYYQKFLAKNNYSEIPLDYINFDSLFYLRNYSSILNWDFSLTKKIDNITELNLSSCALNNNSVAKIITNCLSMKNCVNKVNLSYNEINEEIFNVLIDEKVNAILQKLKELDLSYNSIKFKTEQTSDPKKNIFVVFLNKYPQLEILNLKSTPFEESINSYIKDEIKLHFAKEKNQKYQTQKGAEYEQIKNIIENNCLDINEDFLFIINDLITLKYTSQKRMRPIIPLLDQHILIDNLKPEEKR